MDLKIGKCYFKDLLIKCYMSTKHQAYFLWIKKAWRMCRILPGRGREEKDLWGRRESNRSSSAVKYKKSLWVWGLHQKSSKHGWEGKKEEVRAVKELGSDGQWIFCVRWLCSDFILKIGGSSTAIHRLALFCNKVPPVYSKKKRSQ